jgi:hypothetical protein
MRPRQPYRTVSPALFDRTPKLQPVVDPFPCVVLGNGSLSGSKPMLSGAAEERLATVLRYSTDFFPSPRSLGKSPYLTFGSLEVSYKAVFITGDGDHEYTVRLCSRFVYIQGERQTVVGCSFQQTFRLANICSW